MKAKELRKLIGKGVWFKSNRNHVYKKPDYGVVHEVIRSETRIGDDWHDNKSIEIFEDGSCTDTTKI